MANWRSGVPYGALAMAIGIAFATTAALPAAANSVCQLQACLGAHDINGIALGMSIPQLNEIFDGKLTRVSDDHFEGQKDGVSYDIGISVLGRVYRIDSSQELGRFEPDAAIAKALTDKLVAKYGAPEFNQLPGGIISWDYIEKVSEGSTHYARFTEQLTASFVEHYQAPTTIDIHLIDFRIMRIDQARQNAGPSAIASAKIQF